ncbi:hypothetical protein K0U00_51450, partial [Paenibacillus sepulcri]|nr:hypothetical protein [Paenibacillus sepulcri]
GVYTGGISSNRAYARAPGGGITENSDNVSSAGNITVAGNTRLYTGGFIGIVQDGVDKTVYNAAFAGGITVTAAASDLTNLVSTGGIVGYFADG